MERLYKISEVSKKYKISVRTLRWYEEIGLINSVRTEDYAYRMYTQETLKTIEKILFFKKFDISLTQIGEILNSNAPENLDRIIDEKIIDINQQFEHLDRLRNTLFGGIKDYTDTKDKRDNLTVIKSQKLLLQNFVPSSIEPQTDKHTQKIDDFIVDGQLVIKDKEYFVYFNEKVDLPVKYTVIAKTDNENLRLYVGNIMMIIGWEAKKNFFLIRFNDLREMHFPLPFTIEPNKYYTIEWNLFEDHTTVFIDGIELLNLDKNLSDGRKGKSLGLGTFKGSTVTVKSASYTKDGTTHPLDFHDTNFSVPSNELSDGNLVMRCPSDDVILTYNNTKFRLPFIIDCNVMLQRDNFRVFFGAGKVIFNWERKKFLFADPVTGEITHHNMIYVEPKKFVDLRLCFFPDRFIVEKDGIKQIELTDLPYMKHLQNGKEISDYVSIATAFNNVVTVKEVKVTEVKTEQ